MYRRARWLAVVVLMTLVVSIHNPSAVSANGFWTGFFLWRLLSGGHRDKDCSSTRVPEGAPAQPVYYGEELPRGPDPETGYGYDLYHESPNHRLELDRRPLHERKRSPWKTVQIGTFQSKEELYRALFDSGIYVARGRVVLSSKEREEWYRPLFDSGSNIDPGWSGSELFKELKVAASPSTIELYLLSSADLGLPNGGRITHIYDAAERLGFATVPAEVGPQLLLQHGHELAPDEQWVIGMDPYVNRYDTSHIFSVERTDKGLWLFSNTYARFSLCHGNVCWVFCRK